MQSYDILCLLLFFSLTKKYVFKVISDGKKWEHQLTSDVDYVIILVNRDIHKDVYLKLVTK